MEKKRKERAVQKGLKKKKSNSDEEAAKKESTSPNNNKKAAKKNSKSSSDEEKSEGTEYMHSYIYIYQIWPILYVAGKHIFSINV